MPFTGDNESELRMEIVAELTALRFLCEAALGGVFAVMPFRQLREAVERLRATAGALSTPELTQDMAAEADAEIANRALAKIERSLAAALGPLAPPN